jgi:bla regulator protein blaR1
VTMETIAESLGADEYIDRPVVDRTGLTESFDFTVEWNTKLQDLSVHPQPDESGLSLFEALREQLGLRLKPENGPVDILVIDHVERPSPN